jgi:SAM-dependent methyltransferase
MARRSDDPLRFGGDALGLWAARAAVERGLVPGPGRDLRAWWADAAPSLRAASHSDLFAGDAPLDAWDALAGPAARAAADPGLLGDAYAAHGDDRRSAGRFYTPASIVELALADHVAPGRRILDPACGGGRFLLGALDGGAAPDDLHGIDADARAIAVCRAALYLATGRPALGVRAGDPLLGLAARRAGSLLPPPGALDPGEAAFDLVVGNPPYRAGRLAALGADLRRAFAVAEYQLDPYPLFLELALDAVRPGGVVAMIVPNAWMNVLRGGRLRRLLVGENGLERVVELPADAFGAGVETVVVHVRRGGTTPSTVPTERGVLAVDPARPEAPLALARTPAAAALLHASATWSATLGDVAEVTRGINPYHRCMHTPEEIRARVHHADRPLDATFAPELCGRDLGPYRLWWSGARYVRYGPWLKEPRHPRFFEGPRLLVRKILGETLCAAYCDAPFYCDQSVYVARLRPGQPWPPGALLAFANSRLIADLVRARHQEDDVLFPQIKVAALRALPLPPVDPTSAAVADVAALALRLQGLESDRARPKNAGKAPPADPALRAAVEAAVCALYGVPDGGTGGRR